MPERESAEDVIIDRYIDGSALADAIKNNLFDPADGAQPQKNVPHGHVIDRYTDGLHPEGEGENRSSFREKHYRENNKETSNADPGWTARQSPGDQNGNGVLPASDADLVWLDEPQTLYLKKKLHVHDSVTFAGNLAQFFSSACVRDAMKKVSLVAELRASADNVHFPVFAVDCKGKIIAWNKAMEEITETPAPEMMGKGVKAGATALYGYARPMLIEKLTGSSSRAPHHRRKKIIGIDEVLTGNEEMVWLQGGPCHIRGRARYIHDDAGAVVGAIQSIGILDLSSSMRPFSELILAPGSGIPAGRSSSSLPGDPAVSSLPSRPASPWRSAEIPPVPSISTISDQSTADQTLIKRHEDLHHAIGQLMATEDDLLTNIGEISQRKLPATDGDLRPENSENFAGRVIRDAREGIIVFDSSVRCILWNTFMEQLTGVPEAEVLGKQAFDMIPALRGAGAYLMLDQALSGKTVESSDISCHIPTSGKQVWVRLILSALRDSNGSVMGIIGIVQDTTARKVMEYALQTTIVQLMESEEKYRSVFNAKNDPLILIDMAGRSILDLNNATSDLYGYQREEFFTLSPAVLFSEPEKYHEFLNRQSTGTRMCRQRKKDGTVFPADISFSYFDLKGHLVLILSIRDLSTAYQAADALRLANTKLNLLIGVTRHDVINNLTVLMGYNDLMKHTVKDTKILEMLNKEEIALQALHRQIEFTREYYNLGVKSPVWQNICETSTRAYSQFITTIAFTCDTQDLELYADPLLEKVFYNLFDNAIRHGESITQVRIYCVREGPDLLLIFGDDGQGILPEDKGRIFKRGFGKHTGLGLFLTREILAITRIEITETGEFEKGARFEFRIPAGLYRFPDSGNSIKVSGSETMNLHA